MIRVNAAACLIVPLLVSAANPPVDKIAELTKLRCGAPETSPPLSAFWREPADIRTRDLFYGAGGKENQPVGPLFKNEDRDGTSPKFSVRDANGVEWKVKLGVEVRPETVASRFVWAAGYYVDEDYFLPYLKVEKMQRLHRGQNRIAPDGSMQNVRLKREHKKTGGWKWRHDPFEGTRAWNGLRVLMCLINNWDLKDSNTAIRVIDDQPVYLISDLGASFGAGGWRLRVKDSKGNLQKYERSRFITKLTPEFVTFGVPSRPKYSTILCGLENAFPAPMPNGWGSCLGISRPDRFKVHFARPVTNWRRPRAFRQSWKAGLLNWDDFSLRRIISVNHLAGATFLWVALWPYSAAG